MEVKRFISSTMQEALKLVREEFGPDAVILSNSKLDNGVEIVAALDYEENIAPEAIDQQLLQGGQPSASQIARMHADNHLRLQKELDSAKKKIESVKARQNKMERSGSDNDSRLASATIVNGADSVSHETLSNNARESQVKDAPWDELGEMRHQIAELKDLIKGNSGDRTVPINHVSQVSVVKEQVEKKLEALCVSPSVKQQLLSMVDEHADYQTSWQRVMQRMNYLMTSDKEEFIDKGGRIALVGPTGSGKTMTIGKLAARYVMKYGADSLALVTTDRYRIAAHEQLKVFGRILNVPVHAVDEQNSLDAILKHLSNKKLVLIDTAGLTHSDSSWYEQLQELKMSAHDVECYLTVSAVGQYQVMCSSFQHYQVVGLSGAVVTKVDEAVSLGEVMSFIIDTRLAAAYYTDGQRVPEDIHPFSSKEIIDKAQSLLNSSERWVTISPQDSQDQSNFLFSHSA